MVYVNSYEVVLSYPEVLSGKNECFLM